MSDTTTSNAVTTLPLSVCRLAPENARRASRGPVESLIASIEAEGLIDPLHGYRQGKSVLVWDGGRRLRALKTLAKARKLPPSLADGIPVMVSDREAARRRSLVTFLREGLHPVEELKAYRALFEEGQDAERIAGSLGVEARRVAQILKLTALAPEVLAAFEAGDFGLDTAQAFTLAVDQDQQRQALAACGTWINAGRVRQLLKAQMVSPRDRLARFVGREAYEAAGGGFVVDLFAEGEEAETWSDSGLVERLAAQKLEAVTAALTAEGWAWVTVIEPNDYSWGLGFNRIDATPADLTDGEQAEYDAAAVTLEDEGADGDELDRAGATVARLEAKMACGAFTAEEMAGAGCFVQVDGGGLLTIRKGYVRDPVRANQVSASKSAAEEDPERYGWGHTGHWHMTHIATAAVRHALLENPTAAYDILVASLAWEIVRGGTGAPALKLQPRGVDPRTIPAETRIPGEAAWAERIAAWRERLPDETFEACFKVVIGLDSALKAELLALGVGLGLDAVETRFDQRRRDAWDQLQVFAGHAGVDMAAAWRPDGAFLARGSKAALLAGLAETGGTEAFAKARKGEMVQALADRAADTRWLPKVLESFDKTVGDDVGAANMSQTPHDRGPP